MGGISITHWIIVLVVVVLLFGTSRLKGLGEDVAGMLKGFRSALKEDDDEKPKELDKKP